MTICHGCNQPLEPLAQIRTYHTQCDPQGRVEMLERAMENTLKLSLEAQMSLKDGLPHTPQMILVEIFSAARAALAYQPAQMQGREG